MSVQIIGRDASQYLLSHAIKQSYNKTVDINYSYCIAALCRGKNLETELPAFIECLIELNEVTYSIKYKDKFQNLAQFYALKAISNQNTNTFQALKFAQCLRYNIEIPTIQGIRELTKLEEKAILHLDVWIADMQCAIINELPEYNESKWNE
jgi:hypothetical protein